MIEIWKSIKDYEGYYEVSNMGRVRSLDRYIITKNNKQIFYKGQILNLTPDQKKRNRVFLSKDGETTTKRIYRVVAENFIPNPHNYSDINHIDGNVQNDCVDNLEWCTSDYNRKDQTDNKRTKCRSIKAISQNGNEFRFRTITEASEFTKCASSTISQYLNHKLKSAKGWHFEDLDIF